MRDYDLPTVPTVTFKGAAGQDCQLAVSRILDVHDQLPKNFTEMDGVRLAVVSWWSPRNQVIHTHIRQADMANLRALVHAGRAKLAETGWAPPGAAWIWFPEFPADAAPTDAD